MITYELALELKQNKFPRNGILDDTLEPSCGELLWKDNGGRIRERGKLLHSDIERISVFEWVYAPTLEELIVACSIFDPYDKFLWTLERKSGTGWIAMNMTKTIKTEGETPEEAVSMFFLALNKHG